MFETNRAEAYHQRYDGATLERSRYRAHVQAQAGCVAEERPALEGAAQPAAGTPAGLPSVAAVGQPPTGSGSQAFARAREQGLELGQVQNGKQPIVLLICV